MLEEGREDMPRERRCSMKSFICWSEIAARIRGKARDCPGSPESRI